MQGTKTDIKPRYEVFFRGVWRPLFLQRLKAGSRGYVDTWIIAGTNSYFEQCAFARFRQDGTIRLIGEREITPVEVAA